MTKDDIRGNVPPLKRVLAWWDVDVDIGAFHKRKLTARPLKELERTLGHRLHVESRWRHDRLPPNVWKFEAFHYIDTADPALAAYSMLIQVSQFSDWLGMSWQGYNTVATTTSGDPDDATICAFYWNPPDQREMPRYVSSGVLLKLVDAKPTITGSNFDQIDHHLRLARPVVRPSNAPAQMADYQVEFTVHIICGNKQDLMNFHWPRFQASNWPDGVDHVDVDARTHTGKPNIIRVRQTLRQVREYEAIAYCLAYAQSFRVKLDRPASLRLIGERYQILDGRDGIVSFELNRT
ncbi:MAG: hypothetical protein R3D44_04630 [Hyphomicrobiaceae bacterium]